MEHLSVLDWEFKWVTLMVMAIPMYLFLMILMSGIIYTSTKMVDYKSIDNDIKNILNKIK